MIEHKIVPVAGAPTPMWVSVVWADGMINFNAAYGSGFSGTVFGGGMGADGYVEDVHGGYGPVFVPFARRCEISDGQPLIFDPITPAADILPRRSFWGRLRAAISMAVWIMRR